MTKLKNVLRVVLVSAAVLAAAPAGAQTISGPTTNTVVTPAHDYASSQWQDPWDMQQRTDIGWFTWGVDGPSNITSAKSTWLTSYAGSATDGTTACGQSGTTDCATFKYTSTAAPLFYLLDTFVPGTTPVGKIGAIKPIDTMFYKYLLVKMRFGTANNNSTWGSTFGSPPQAQIVWSRNTIYTSNPDDGSALPNGGYQNIVTHSYGGSVTLPGWVFEDDIASQHGSVEGADANQWYIFAIRLDQATWYNINTSQYTSAATLWGQSGVTADSLALEPIANPAASNPGTTEIDWVQLTDALSAANETVTWSSGAADVVISQQAGCGNYTVIAKDQTSPFTYNFGSLPAGSYYVGLRVPRNDGSGGSIPSVTSCSPGAYVVPAPSTLAFTTPSPTGSTDDYATTFLRKAWNFSATSDFDSTANMSGNTITTIPAQRPDGTSLGNISVFDATSTAAASGAANGNPYGYLLDWNVRGAYNRIDPSRYRILTVDMGINHQRDLTKGSISRIVWHVSGDQSLFNGSPRFLENVSDDIPIRHLATSENNGVYVLDEFSFDMKDRSTMDLEGQNVTTPPNESSPSRSGWTSSCISPWCGAGSSRPGLDGFRFDPHEFPAATEFYVQQVKLAALEQTGAAYTLRWTSALPSISGLNPTIYLYGDPVVATADTRGTQTGATLGVNTGVDLSATDASAAFSSHVACDQSTLSSYAINPGGTAIASGSGSYAWTVGSPFTSGDYYVCGVVHGTINGADTVLATTRTPFPITVNTSYQQKPRLYMNRSVLHFAAVYDRTTNSFTAGPSQTVTVAQSGAGTASWSLSVADATTGAAVSYVSLNKTLSSGTGTFTVSVTPNPNGDGSWNLPSCTVDAGLSLILKLSSNDTDNDPQYMQIFVTVRPKAGQTCVGGLPTAASAPPLGFMDLPVDGSIQTGAFAVTGWAVDDIGIAKVQLWRSCTSVDAAANACAPAPGGSTLVFIGDADMVPDARPDVAAVYPNYPANYQAAWGYLVLSNFMPDLIKGTTAGGQGQFIIYAFAQDVEGNVVQIGQKTVNLDNEDATQPFGAIDTPAQGGLVPDPNSSDPQYTNANAYSNWGWAMTQNPKCIDTTSTSSYAVLIDGVSETLNGSNWTAGLARPDLHSLFPGLCNTDSAVARYVLNVGALSLVDGLHTIIWHAFDNGTPSNVGFFGSRYFSIEGGGVTGSQMAAAITSPVGRDIGRPARAFDLTRTATGILAANTVRRPAVTFDAGVPNVPMAVGVDLLDQLRLTLPKSAAASDWSPYFVRNGELALLPLGSTFDAKAARFSWAPMPGQYGTYTFLFIRRGADGRQEKLPVQVTVGAPSRASVSAAAPDNTSHQAPGDPSSPSNR